jgi:predicted MPP superfamily phosphohydrolase
VGVVECAGPAARGLSFLGMHFPIAVVVALIVALNLGGAAIFIGLLRRRRPWARALGAAAILWAVTMSALGVVQIFAPTVWKPFLRHWLYFPFAVEMVWNVLFLEPCFLALALTAVAIHFSRSVTHAEKAVTAPEPGAMSRRNFVYLLAGSAVPAASVAMGVHGVLTRHDLRVHHYRLAFPGLPAGLEGFTIAHLSDLHSGIFCGPERMRLIGEATNDLKPDLITITGDIINNNKDEFADALTMIQKLETRHGIYLCEGNHDTFAGPGVIAQACADNGIPWLYRSCAVLPVNGARLILGGLPWMSEGFEGQPEIVSSLYPARAETDFRILLAHHPHLFDIASDVDLVLAGHTHGGQIMAGDEIGLGPLFFRYWSGLYQRDRTSLIVSNGCGDWFPCRIGAPAEIGLVRLTAA